MKKVLLLIISIFTLVTLTGCANPNNMGKMTATAPNMDNITINLKSLSDKKAVFTVINNSANSYYYRPDDALEKKENNEWKIVPPKESMSYAAVIETLDAYNSMEVTLDIEFVYGKLSSGTYRFVKEFTNENEAIKAKCEFKIN